MARNRTLSVPVEDDYLSLPPEPQMGNIEYKLKLVNPSATRLQHLVTQVRKLTLRSRNTYRAEVPVHTCQEVSFISDPVLDFWLISDPGSRGQKGTGSRTRIRNTV